MTKRGFLASVIRTLILGLMPFLRRPAVVVNRNMDGYFSDITHYNMDLRQVIMENSIKDMHLEECDNFLL